MGGELLDYVQKKIPGMRKPASVMDTGPEKVPPMGYAPAFPLTPNEPYGTEAAQELMKQSGLTTGTERPLFETGAAVAAPFTGMAALKTGKALAPTAKEMTQFALEKSMEPYRMNVVKPTGAQTITEHLPKELSSLKRQPASLTRKNAEQQLEDVDRALVNYPGGEGLTPDYHQRLLDLRDTLVKDVSLNKWVDTTLRKYLIRDMGTPDDPLVRLAEQGISHSPHMREIAAVGEFGEATTPYLANVRETLGFPREGLATTPLGKAVEVSTDFATGMPFKNTTEAGQGFTARNRVGLNLPEWTQKLDPETNLYAPSLKGLEFEHMLDVLSEDLATGRIRPEQLSKLSLEQAVRRTQQYDDDLAAKMNASKAAARSDLPVHQEYNTGFKWIELNKPGSFAAESDAMGHSVRGYEPPKGHPDWVEASGNSGHESYGHGGWEAIKSGRAKVYSLVDDKGQPHATVEVKTPDLSGIINRLPNKEYAALGQPIRERHFGGSQEQAMANYSEYNKLLEQAYLEKYGEPPAIITQIKGKQNKAPAPDYQPYVADFVRQGNWSPEIGDLNYTDLVRIGDKMIRKSELGEMAQLGESPVDSQVVDWFRRAARMDPNGLSEFDRGVLEAIKSFKPPKMAFGGGVFNTDPDITDSGRIIPEHTI